jgi:hypothetical protein
MKNHRFPLLLLLLPACFGLPFGCAKQEEAEVLDPLPPKSQELDGAVDTKFVGLWATKDQKQHLSLSADGKARMQATVGTRIGPQKMDSRMEWKVDGKSIGFKDSNGVVSKFDISLKGDELTLKSLRSMTTYLKQK